MKPAAVKLPPVEPPLLMEELPNWWQAWIDYVRNSPRRGDEIHGERVYWGEHLFIGCETHHELSRVPRAFGRQASVLSDTLQYEEVTDLRTWAKTKPAPLLLHEKILGEHCYIVGPTGAGKSSLGIMPLLIQLMRGAKTTADERPAPYPVIVLDLKGDSALFHTVKAEAEARKQPFQFFTTEKHTPTYRFNPFRGFDRGSRSVAQLCQLILDALNLNHGKGYGRSYYTERSRNVLSKTLKSFRNVQSFDELHAALRETVARADSRTKADAFELVSVIEMLTEYRQLVTDPDETISSTEGIIFMPSVLENRQVVYFWLPAALESISVSEIAKLVLFNLRVAAQDWKRAHPQDRRNVILVIDELQRVAGENLQGILQDARSFGIHTILANQSLSDLKSPTGFDLAPTIMTNTRVKFLFTSPSERECYVYVERGKGFTEARQFPQQGNPWLRDLGPEEFAYHVRLAWPFSFEEYQRRETLPPPTWNDVPGGNFYREDQPAAEQAEPEAPSTYLPRDFPLRHDEEWERQVAAIQALFDEDEDDPALAGTLFDEQEAALGVIPPEDIKQMRTEILESIAERGPDRTRCVLNLMFDRYLRRIEAPSTWRTLRAECWKEESTSTLKGADDQPHKKVRQTIYRAREILQRYFASPAGQRWPYRAVIDPKEYRLRYIPNISPEDHDDRPPSERFPG